MSTLAVPATLRMKANCAARSGTSIPFASLDSSYFLFQLATRRYSTAWTTSSVLLASRPGRVGGCSEDPME